MLRALSVAFWAFIGITSPVFFVGALLIFLVTCLFDRRRVVLHLYSSAWAMCYVRLNPLWRLRVQGRDRLPWHGPAVLVANHASLVDILVLFGLYRPFKWVSKQEIFKIPVIGWNMRLNGYVPLVRGSSASVRLMMERCDRLLTAGSPIMIFPEGSRSQDGALRAFKNGAFELAVRHGVPVFPIVVHGSGRALPKHGLILRDRADMRIEVLEPLDAADHAGVPELRDAARQAISASLSAGTPSAN